eukprot:scaffold706_cov418-Prasinococcus_capsulatus_cf.AAC.1
MVLVQHQGDDARREMLLRISRGCSPRRAQRRTHWPWNSVSPPAFARKARREAAGRGRGRAGATLQADRGEARCPARAGKSTKPPEWGQQTAHFLHFPPPPTDPAGLTKDRLAIPASSPRATAQASTPTSSAARDGWQPTGHPKQGGGGVGALQVHGPSSYCCSAVVVPLSAPCSCGRPSGGVAACLVSCPSRSRGLLARARGGVCSCAQLHCLPCVLRENTEYFFRFNRRTLAAIALFGVAVPYGIYKMTVFEMVRVEDDQRADPLRQHARPGSLAGMAPRLGRRVHKSFGCFA